MKELILENHLFAPNTVRIQGENSLLFVVEPNPEYKRSKIYADAIGKHIVEAVNNYQRLLDSNAEMMKLLERTYHVMEGDSTRKRTLLDSIHEVLAKNDYKDLFPKYYPTINAHE
jgi:hypothetical protein